MYQMDYTPSTKVAKSQKIVYKPTEPTIVAKLPARLPNVPYPLNNP